MAKKKKKPKFVMDYTPKEIRERAKKELERAHKEFEDKKSGKRIKAKSKARKRPIKEVQKQFKDLQAKAMARVKELRKNKMLEYSRAYQMALETKPKTTNTRRALFHIEDRSSYKEIRREVARMQEFLNDETSTVEGAKWSTQELTLYQKYGGAFGRGWYETYGVTFDKSRVSEDYAKTAYKVFRYLEEMKGSYDLMYGEGSYDSDSLMISIYDMVVQKDIKLDEDGIPLRNSAENFYDTIISAREKLQAYKDAQHDKLEAERLGGNTDTGVLEKDNLLVDLLEKAGNSREFLKLLF
jgi:hypothetical protein